MTDEQNCRIFSCPYLSEFSTAVFMHFGVSEVDARQAADVLAQSDLRGIDSHGVARLHTYFEMLELGRINPKPNIKIIREKASVATVDGDNGLGLVVGPKANEIAMDKAEQHGSGWVSVCNTNHFGIAGYYPLKALERDLIGWAMTNTTKLVAPLWGAERMLGTNPIAIAFPGLKEPPIVIDMATSAVAYGKIEIALRKNESVPKGWVVDKHGADTTNPQDMIDGGAQLPLGSDREMGGHKGYGLGVDGRHPVLRPKRRQLGPVRATVCFAPRNSRALASAKASATSSAPCRSTASSTKTSSKDRSTIGFTSSATPNPPPAPTAR